MNFGNHRYSNEQNCILLICKCKLIKHFAPPPNPKTVPTALLWHGISVWQHIGQSTTAISRHRRDITLDV